MRCAISLDAGSVGERSWSADASMRHVDLMDLLTESFTGHILMPRLAAFGTWLSYARIHGLSNGVMTNPRTSPVGAYFWYNATGGVPTSPNADHSDNSGLLPVALRLQRLAYHGWQIVVS